MEKNVKIITPGGLSEVSCLKNQKLKIENENSFLLYFLVRLQVYIMLNAS